MKLDYNNLGYERYFDIHKCCVRLITNSSIIEKETIADFGFFLTGECEHPDLTIYTIVETKPVFDPPQNSIVVYGEEITFFFQKDRYLYAKLNNDTAFGIVDIKQQKMIVRGNGSNIYFFMRGLLNSYISFLLEQKGLSRFHGATLAENSGGIIFAAKKSGGKSTISFYLLKNGFKYLSDDITLLGNLTGKLLVFSYPLRLAIDEKVIGCADRINSPYKTFMEGQRRKLLVPSDKLARVQILRTCEPKYLIFPILCTSKKSQLMKIANKQALTRLVRFSPASPFWDFTNGETLSQQRFETALNLVTSVECYEMYVGTEPEYMINLIRDLLKGD